MIDLNEHIKYLLCHHDCVVVPSLGAFLAHRKSAELKASTGEYMPPVRHVSFNSAIAADDGVLTWSVSRREGISYRMAAAEVSAAVESISSIIEACGYIDIDRVGRLERQSSGSLEFLPDASSPVSNAALSLLPVLSLAPVAEQTTPAEVEISETAGARRRNPIVRFGRYAASVAALIALGFALSTPIAYDSNNAMPAQASLALPAVRKAAPAPIVVTPAPKAKPQGAPAAPVVTKAEPKQPDVVMVKDLKVANPEEAYKCYVIVASCASRREANRYIRNKKGADSMRVIESDGRYRVYIAASNDYDAAFRFKSTDKAVTAAHPNAWVYRR